ncbi:PEP-CTERM sorting domain-containing protein [Roseateles sp.]|uniref:PEP-CTERM sorting domain-containing protein n=1 Tax=Roseateles sp. TaxID=1971397 RepID=UPI003264D899
MKLATLALALGLASPAFAAAPLSVDFEKDWGFSPEVGDTYAAEGVTFTNVLGLSNNADETFFSNAPSPLGIAYAQLDGSINTTAYMNVAAGVTGGLSFYYAGTDVSTVKAYSGLNGTGMLLGTITLASTGGYDSWTKTVLSFSGSAQSFDLTSTAGIAALDNIAAVPEPTSIALMLAGGALLLARRRRA